MQICTSRAKRVIVKRLRHRQLWILENCKTTKTFYCQVRPFMCPYCQKTFKTSVNCKKHMKTHKHELAMQALQQQQTSGGLTDQPAEITISQEVPEVRLLLFLAV